MSLGEAISSFEAPITPSRWAKRDSSCVGVTTLEGLTTLYPPCLRQSRHVDDRRHLQIRSMDYTRFLAEAFSSFEALITPCLWERVDSSCVGVTTGDGVTTKDPITTLNPSCHRQSRHVDDRRHLLIRSMDYTKSLAEAISSFEALTTPCRWAKRDSSFVGVTTLNGVMTINWPIMPSPEPSCRR